MLSEPEFFDSERERVLVDYPLLNSHGLGQVRRRRRISGSWVTECIPGDLDVARDELRAGGCCERGIRNTLEYFVDGRVSLSYRLKGCGWARRFNGPAPPKRSSYGLKHEVETYLRERDKRLEESGGAPGGDRYTSNGAFVCAALMAGLRIWSYQDSVNPDLRLGRPWAVAGLQPEDYGHPDDERMARFWRWAVQQDAGDAYIEDFIADTVGLLYEGADLKRLDEALETAGSEALEAYRRLRREFGLEMEGEGIEENLEDKARVASWARMEPRISDGMTSFSRLGFMAGEIQVPDDFDSMGGPEIEEMFGGNG